MSHHYSNVTQALLRMGETVTTGGAQVTRLESFQTSAANIIDAAKKTSYSTTSPPPGVNEVSIQLVLEMERRAEQFKKAAGAAAYTHEGVSYNFPPGILTLRADQLALLHGGSNTLPFVVGGSYYTEG